MKNYKKGRKIIKELEGKRPIKRMGQNFLINKNIIKRIVQSADIKENDFILEIGAGTGILTERIAENNCNILAIEKDFHLFNLLNKKFEGLKNIKIINDDALKFNLDNLPKKYKIIANIPYYITSPLIRKFLETEKQPEAMVLTIQKEVAKRISSPSKTNLLSISVNYYAKTKIIMKISRNSFWPAPKVESAVIEIIPFKRFNREESLLFFKVVKAGFSSPRKQVINNISASLKIEKNKLIDFFSKNGYDFKKRPEDFSLDEWISLAKMINNIV